MKQIATIIILLFIAFNVNAQKRKEIKEKGVKTKIVWKYDYKTGKEKKLMESKKKFDENGNTIEDILYDEYEKIDAKVKYSYNEDNDIIKEIHYLPSNKIKKTIEYKYKAGFKTEKIVFDNKGKMKSKKVYQYLK